jgi:hypothetical protein
MIFDNSFLSHWAALLTSTLIPGMLLSSLSGNPNLSFRYSGLWYESQTFLLESSQANAFNGRALSFWPGGGYEILEHLKP